MILTTFLFLVSTLLCGAETGLPALDNPGWDLATYVSRPGLNPPLFNITVYDAEAITPGYWFMAPYSGLGAKALGPEYIPYQAGPQIFDNQGELVWSGSHLVKNRNTFDFRLTTFKDAPALTYVMDSARNVVYYPDGAGVILDTSYQLQAEVEIKKPGEDLNFHEFKIIDGRTSLSAIEKTEEVDVTYLNIPPKTAKIHNTGFRETEIETGKVLFEWYPANHIGLPESMLMPPADLGATSYPWDCFHTNSIDKNTDGDYLVSMRYTSTIYKISGKNKAIIWRLGGRNSNFIQDFNFSSQHDAKFYYYNNTVTIISFLDNASDERNRQPSTATTSAVKLVALYEHETPKRAVLLKEVFRPDGGLTQLRGQAQILPNDGVAAGWSEHGYISEHAPDGRCILEGKYVGTRFNSYRAYKFNFIGRPADPPVMKVYAYGSEYSSISTVFYVSWNGATEVKTWTFYGRNNLTQPYQILGNTTKSGFETTFVSNQFWAFSYAEAYDVDGVKLGFSLTEEAILPNRLKQNFTLADLSFDEQHDVYDNEAEEADEKVVLKASKSIVVVSSILVIVLVLGLLTTVSVLTWKRRDSSSEQKYSVLHHADGPTNAEVSELTPFRIDEEDENESDDELGDILPPASPPQNLKRGHGRTTSIDIENKAAGHRRLNSTTT